MKKYIYICEWCHHVIEDDEEAMKDHCLRIHGVTGHIKRGYKIKTRHIVKIKRKRPITL